MQPNFDVTNYLQRMPYLGEALGFLYPLHSILYTLLHSYLNASIGFRFAAFQAG